MANHAVLTRAAFDVLPADVRAFWDPCEASIIDDYCRWPDRWQRPEDHARIDPYLVRVDGVAFHYPPMSRPQYLYWTMKPGPDGPALEPLPHEPNEHWRFFRDAATQTLGDAIDDIRADRRDDAAKRLGITLHVLQDTHILHALEGPWGTDCFVLDRLVDVPQGPTHESSMDLIFGKGALPTEADITGHEPVVEGETLGEIVFRLYQRYVASALANRKLHLPLLQAAIAGDDDTRRALQRRLFDTLARLSADAIHTITQAARDAVTPEERDRLAIVHLDDLEPLDRPWVIPGTPYRYTGMVRGVCLDADHRRHPLRVRCDDGSIHTSERGWGSGVHVAPLPWQWELPEGVYAKLRGVIGLHAELGVGGEAELRIELAGRTLVHERLCEDRPSVPLDLPMHDGGMLSMSVHRPPGSDGGVANIAWCDMHLERAPH